MCVKVLCIMSCGLRRSITRREGRHPIAPLPPSEVVCIFIHRRCVWVLELWVLLSAVSDNKRLSTKISFYWGKRNFVLST